MTREPVAGPPGGTGRGVGYGCPCGKHVGFAPDAEQAIAAVRECDGPVAGTGQTPGRKRPAWLAERTPRPAKTPPNRGTPERTTDQP
jgi:hypothetical protein